MPQAIQTKYLPATNCKPSRIKAWCKRGSITISYPHELSGDAVHIAAADALVAKFVKEDAERYKGEKDYSTYTNPWSRPRVVGGLPGGGMAHVFIDGYGRALQAIADGRIPGTGSPRHNSREKIMALVMAFAGEALQKGQDNYC